MSKEHLNYLRRKTADEAELWAADRIEELERENNELLADAMRYRWIKEQSDGRPFYFHAIGHKHAENLDAAIDAALAKVRRP